MRHCKLPLPRFCGSGRLSVLETDIGTDAGRGKLRSAAEAMGPLRSVVASLGEFWQGPLVVDLPRESLDNVLEQRLFSHLSVLQTLMPLLRGPGSSLIQINGLAAVVAIPGLSALHISTAAQLALTRTLIAEADAGSPLITSLLIDQWVKTRSRQQLPEDALTAKEVGNEVVRIILNATGHAILNLSKSDGQVHVAPLSSSDASAAVQDAQDALPAT